MRHDPAQRRKFAVRFVMLLLPSRPAPAEVSGRPDTALGGRSLSLLPVFLLLFLLVP
ncbi:MULTISPECIES: hypothetical protein [Streptomyces]|uniref:Uncharacterized protein n=1 Tax=Streptomyces griseosporeus TaxID=1910 RepID=A0ABV3KZ52_STRGS|nr:hypothetical protein [Streptomyces actuosus]MBM4823691.1 hypothetical protein [Streptomyces actuosus]